MRTKLRRHHRRRTGCEKKKKPSAVCVWIADVVVYITNGNLLEKAFGYPTMKMIFVVSKKKQV